MAEKIMVTRSSMPPFEEYIEMIAPLWESVWLTNNGPLHKQFELALMQYLKVPHLSLMTNGHMSLELSLQAFGLSEGDPEAEVITTPFTFASTTHAIVRNGLKPVFCDIRRDNYTMDPGKIEELITGKTKAIVPVHTYGSFCDVNRIHQIAEKYHLKVIYDAAHTFGIRVSRSLITPQLAALLPDNKEDEHGGMVSASVFGDASILSFHATKVFHSVEGGCVVYSDPAIGERLYHLKNFGIMSETDVEGVGANAKMDEFRAAMGICNLKHIEEEIAKRKVRAERYRSFLSGCAGLTLPPEQEGVCSNYAYFPVLFEDAFPKNRDEVYEELRRQNVFARRYFYPLTSQFSCYEGMFDPSRTPVALDVSERVLVLPLYADMPLETVDRICACITGS